MNLNLVDCYVTEELRRIERARTAEAAVHRAAWEQQREVANVARRHAAAGWLGDRLVAVGERLRAWSMGRISPLSSQEKGRA